MNRLKLMAPSREYEVQVMAYKEALLNNHDSLDGCGGLEEVDNYSEWLDFESRLSKKYGDDYVPSTLCLAVTIEDNRLVGMIDFRHHLSEFLFRYGGNIGYSVLPTQRKKGYATEMLELMLERCAQMGTDKVLITCDKMNAASGKTIIANGGVLENEVKDEVGLSESGIIQRYWIRCKPPILRF